MAKIGDIYLGGAEGSTNHYIFNSGISFFLTDDSKISNILSFENGRWEVELKEGQQSIIARCTDALSEDEVLESGLKYCQQAIDFLSVEYAENLSIQEIGNFHIILYKKDCKFILKQVQTSDSMLTINATVEVRDVNGNIIPQPAPPKPKWTPALRFYRLSQNTNDLYEAYRNAFLSFEFLLNEIHSTPMKKNGKPSKGERGWFKDALTIVNSKINLTDYVPQGTSDPIEYIVKSQYDDIRCKLFHAKGVFIGQCPLNIIVPADTFNPIEVSNAYEQLMILVKQILIVYNNIIFAGGVVTHQGFKLMMWNNLSNGYALFANSDDSPINGDLIEKRMFPLAEEQLRDQEQLLSKIFSQISPKKNRP